LKHIVLSESKENEEEMLEKEEQVESEVNQELLQYKDFKLKFKKDKAMLEVRGQRDSQDKGE
jgi:hypothetical protein